MIRVLAMIAVAGFVLSVASLAAAFAVAGPEALTRGGWNLAAGHWGADWTSHSHGRWTHGDTGPQATRTLAWSGADHLDVSVAADIRYVQAAGPATVTVSGPQGAVNDIVVSGPSIRYGRGGAYWRPRVSIVVRAPNIHAFDLSGDNTLAIEDYRQDKLSLDVSGSGEVTAAGEAREIELELSGSGDVDLARLKTRGADVDISGAADATIAPTEWARLEISGMGDIRLLTQPARLETDVSGAGRIRQEQPEPPQAPQPPQPPPAPKV